MTADDLTGQQLRDYAIEEEIGRGGMGTVYRARQLTLDRVCALKVLRLEFAANPQYRQRFLQEARSAARLNHPNIVTVHDAGEEDGKLFIAMHYVDGPTVADLLRDGPLEPTEAIRIIEQVSAALDAAHRQGLIHRDVKPANILIGRDGQARLADFGIARVTAEAGLTATGMLVGTPAYMAPEQTSGESPTAQTDIYQLGITAFELLTGQTPYAGRATPAMLVAHFQEPPPLAHEMNVALEPELSPVITKAISKLPADRYPSAGVFAAELASAARNPIADAAATVAAPELPPPKPAHTLHDRTTERSRAVPEERRLSVPVGWKVIAGATSVVILAGLVSLIAVRMLDRSPSEDAATETAASVAASNTSTGEPDSAFTSDTTGVPARGETISAPAPSELWPPDEIEGTASFEADGQFHLRLEAPDATFFKQALGSSAADGAAYLEIAMTEIASAYQEACLHARIEREADGRYRGYQFCLTGSAESYAEYYELDPEGNPLVQDLLLPFNIAPGTKPPSDFNTLEIVARDSQFWFVLNGETVGAIRHTGSAAGDIGVSFVRDGAEPAEFVFGAFGFLALAEQG